MAIFLQIGSYRLIFSGGCAKEIIDVRSYYQQNGKAWFVKIEWLQKNYRHRSQDRYKLNGLNANLCNWKTS